MPVNIAKPVWGVLVGLGVIAAVMAARAVTRPVLTEHVAAEGRTLGPAGAPVKIIEFTDFQCPACAQASILLHEEVRRARGRILLELKYFPLPMHQHARRAAVIAACALDQGKFWPMEQLLFKSQKSWVGMDNPDDYFLSLARGLGLDDVKMMRCMSDHAVAARIEEDVAQGHARGVAATPTFFINGKMAVGTKNLQQVLAGEMK